MKHDHVKARLKHADAPKGNGKVRARRLVRRAARCSLAAVLLALGGCSVTTMPPAADGGFTGDAAALTCMDVWQRFDAREAEFRATCVHVRTFDFDDNGCLNGTQPTTAQLASCGALIDAATSCETLADAMRACEGGSTGASACGETVHTYDVARGTLICPYSWHACPTGTANAVACTAQLHAATDCAQLATATAACAQ